MTDSSTTHYSIVDRAIHKLAFGSPMLQDMLNDIERSLFSKSWSRARAEKPIFITSLPRAGTTIILESLCRLPSLATHTYRDMPFILTPVLWHKLAKVFYRKGIYRERAHGDGLSISEDSPEAFEEVLWKKYFSEKYTDYTLELWPVKYHDGTDKEFFICFHEHMKKIIFLRQPNNIINGRYISKNNANISRVGFLKSLFPEAHIMIPLRNPIEHAISLWRQHINFMGQHVSDDFTRRYMEDIGHYEFGVLHRTLRFPNFVSLTHNLEPTTLDYWLGYWISAFEYLSEQLDISILHYETLCQSAAEGMFKLCKQLEIDATEEDVINAAGVFHSPSASREATHCADVRLTKRAMGLYDLLQDRCLLKQLL